ncbi:MAG: T9SS type A sorting domain-containing protein [Candidatus Kapabacteria bacterium]|nr:T9SS type A sorting domain-containing protein [Candidatus Kapabacteria bacterium]
MKKSLLTVLMVVFFTAASYSQTYNLMTARDGYDALLNNVPGLEIQSELIIAEAVAFPESVLEIDLLKGTATMWTYLFKSKDISDTALYEFFVYNIDNEYFFEDNIINDVNAQDYATLDINWKDTDILGTGLQQNTNLMKFYNDNIDKIAQLSFNLNNSSEFSSDVWQVGITSDDGNFAVCSYNSVTLSLLDCDLPLSVEDFVTDKIRLYPNPATDFINIDLPYSGEVSLELYNTYGEVVKTGGYLSSGILNYNISNINSGVYNLVIRSSTAVYSKAIVIVK